MKLDLTYYFIYKHNNRFSMSTQLYTVLYTVYLGYINVMMTVMIIIESVDSISRDGPDCPYM